MYHTACHWVKAALNSLRRHSFTPILTLGKYPSPRNKKFVVCIQATHAYYCHSTSLSSLPDLGWQRKTSHHPVVAFQVLTLGYMGFAMSGQVCGLVVSFGYDLAEFCISRPRWYVQGVAETHVTQLFRIYSLDGSLPHPYWADCRASCTQQRP